MQCWHSAWISTISALRVACRKLPNRPRTAVAMTGEPKRDLRLRVIDARRAMTDAEREAHDERLRTTAITWLRSRADVARLTVAGYVPMAHEPGGPELPAALAAHIGRLLLPIWRPDNDLDWAEYDGDLAISSRGPHEPRGARLGVDAVVQADVVIVPAIAVDRQGMRLGRGGGSYDRALGRLGAESIKLALLYPGEILTEPVPAEPHDQPVHGVIAPDRVHWL